MKKGFISMSVVYSFVIIFLLLVLSIVSSNLSKVKLLNYIVDKAKEETTKSNINQTYIFGYTGASQKFIVPATGVYKIEAWGASGGGVINGGKGGYRETLRRSIHATLPSLRQNCRTSPQPFS
jgi:hypothetical protein